MGRKARFPDPGLAFEQNDAAASLDERACECLEPRTLLAATDQLRRGA
jgi:hypothetical protein